MTGSPPNFTDQITPADLEMSHTLVRMATYGSPFSDLLARLRDYLGVRGLVVVPAPGAPPDDSGALIVPLHHRGRLLGDLVIDAPPDARRDDLAARAALFAPVVALALAASALSNTAPGAPGELVSLRDERDRLEAVLEATNDAILMINPEGIVVLATLQFETFMGIPRYQFLGLPVEVLARAVEAQPGLPAGLASMLHAVGSSPTESLGGEIDVFEPQQRVLVWYSLPVSAQSGTRMGRIFAFHDVTREREVDRMKTEFITLVSHELRTPLTSVKGFSDLILEGRAETLDSELREYLDIIAANANRLIALINDILDVTRIESERVELKPVRCSLGDVIQQVVLSLEPLIDEHGHVLAVEIEPELPPVWADPARMAQIMTNLLGNAIKYTLEPGRITITARAITQPEQIPPSAGRPVIVPCVLVAVRDTGVGIAPEDQVNLFKRFYRVDTETSRLVGGTGLGLTIVKSFVEMHGGTVWLESAPGQGSTFFFTVPIVEGQTASAA